MRKITLLAAAAAAVLALAAAAGTSLAGNRRTAAPTKTLRVAMVTDVSGLNDRGFNHLAYVGLQQAQKTLGAQIRVAESASDADYIPNLSSFARQGYDLVVGVGFTEIDAMNTVATKFPNTRFAIVDVSNHDLSNHPKN